LRGFLNAAFTRNPLETASLLDAAIAHPVLGYWFPALQVAVTIDQRGSERLEESLSAGLAPGRVYNYLSYGRVMITIPSVSLRRIILKIATLSLGYEIAVHVFGMCVHYTKSAGETLVTELVQCGRELVLQCNFDHADQGRMLDYHLGEIINSCFIGCEASSAATSICHKLKKALLTYKAYPYEYKDLLGSLLRLQPLSVLTVFIDE